MATNSKLEDAREAWAWAAPLPRVIVWVTVVMALSAAVGALIGLPQ